MLSQDTVNYYVPFSTITPWLSFVERKMCKFILKFDMEIIMKNLYKTIFISEQTNYTQTMR